MSMVGSPWRDVWRPAVRSHRRSLHAQLDSIHQHRISNVCERRITYRGCSPASRDGHDGRIGKITSPRTTCEGYGRVCVFHVKQSGFWPAVTYLDWARLA